MRRPCLERDCSRLTTRTRCTLHERAEARARNAARADEMAFYNTPQWRQIRTTAVQSGRCYWCGVTGKRLVGDHVIPVSLGGPTLDPANVVAACYSCNNRRRGIK